MKEELNWDEEKVNMVVSKIAGVSGVLIFIFITYIFVISDTYFRTTGSPFGASWILASLSSDIARKITYSMRVQILKEYYEDNS